jgi:hypothetical protein
MFLGRGWREHAFRQEDNKERQDHEENKSFVGLRKVSTAREQATAALNGLQSGPNPPLRISAHEAFHSLCIAVLFRRNRLRR